MITLTKSEAEHVFNYYSKILIGKPIMKHGNSNPILISSIQIEKLEEDICTIMCIGMVNGRPSTKTFRKLESIIQEFNLVLIEEVLSNPNL